MRAAVYVVLVSTVTFLSGCATATNSQPPRSTDASAMSASRSMQGSSEKSRMASVTARPKPNHPRVQIATHYPNGKKQVFETLVRHESDYGRPPKKTKSGKTLPTEPAEEQFEQTGATVPFPVPQLVVHHGWLYASGQSPCVGTTAVVAEADGSHLLLYYYPEGNTGDQPYCRVCYLEGTNGAARVYPNPEGTGNMVQIPVGTYVDVIVDTDRVTLPFKAWKDGATPVPRPISTLVSDPYHTYIMGEVASGRETEDVR